QSGLADEASSAFRLACRDGNFVYAAYAGLTLATVLAAQGAPHARDVAWASLDAALNSNSPNLAAHARLRVVHVLNELGDARQAFELAQRLTAATQMSTRYRWEARLTQAQALFGLNNVPAAEAIALECYERGDKTNRGLIHGFALRLLASC